MTAASVASQDTQRGGDAKSGAGIDTGAALHDVMRAEEGTRAHGFSAVMAFTALLVLCWVPWLGGHPTAKAIFIAAVALVGIASLGVWYATRDVERYTRSLHRSYACTLVLAAPGIEHYLGLFSPVVVVLTLAVYHLGQSAARRDSFLFPLLIIASYVLHASLITYGLIPEVGLYAADHVPLAVRLFTLAAVTAVLVITLKMARVSRGSMLQAIGRSNQALMLAQKREIQLAEAQQHLDRALAIAIGKPGRHTGKLAGPYRMGVLIGMGAMGEVYAAEHTHDGTAAAVKLLQPDVLRRPDLVERFLREGAICKQLDSPYVVRVFEVGRVQDGAPFLAMERLEGRDLATMLRKAGHLPVHEVVRLAKHVGAGLTQAHLAGVTHRDLKPLNLFESAAGGDMRWKILDFGVSKLKTSSSTLTQHGVVGTPSYMSPEQARGMTVDHRSDIFAMASVLYRALTGRPAFAGKNTPQIMFDVVYRNPERPSAVMRGLSSDIDLVLAVALAKDPEARFQTAEEFSLAFEMAAELNLDPGLRTRGHTLVKGLGWGQYVERSSPNDAIIA